MFSGFNYTHFKILRNKPSYLDSSGKKFLLKMYIGNTEFDSEKKKRLINMHTSTNKTY